MIQEMSAKDVEEMNAKVREYRDSRNPKRKIIGILMDTGVGSVGLYESDAEKKAEEILKEFTAFTL